MLKIKQKNKILYPHSHAHKIHFQEKRCSVIFYSENKKKVTYAVRSDVPLHVSNQRCCQSYNHIVLRLPNEPH